MNWTASISLIGIGFLIGFAFGDTPIIEASMTMPQGTCDPAKTQVLRMDNSEQITQVLDRGVTCIVVMQ